MSANQSSEKIIEHTPRSILAAYVTLMQGVKRGLDYVGCLQKLDHLAKQHRFYHYMRALLAIHQLDDMIALDTPWWTYSVIAAVEAYIQQKSTPLQVFEYGSGASTVWLAKRCTQIISVEHDLSWYQRLDNQLNQLGLKQVQLSWVAAKQQNTPCDYGSVKAPNMNFEAYVRAIQHSNQLFDLIIIDGRSREACLRLCVPYLKPGGIIIFDNANRQRYQSALMQSGLEIRRFYGWVPGSPLKSETAILSHKLQ